MIKAFYSVLAATEELNQKMGEQIAEHAWSKLKNENNTFNRLSKSLLNQNVNVKERFLLTHNIAEVGALIVSELKSNGFNVDASQNLFIKCGNAKSPNGFSFDWAVCTYFDGDENGCISKIKKRRK